MDSVTNWADDEPALSQTAVDVTTRLLQRSRRTWPVWFAIVFALCLAQAVRKVLNPPIVPAEVIVRLVEGPMETEPGLPISTTLLRAKIFDRAFTRTNLTEVLRRHATAFPRLGGDPVAAVDDLLTDVDVNVSENEFMQYRVPNDPPRSVKISVAYRHADVDVAWSVARELADLVVKVVVGEQRRDLEVKAAASTEATVQGAEALRSLFGERTVTDATQPGERPAKPPAKAGAEGAEAFRSLFGEGTVTDPPQPPERPAAPPTTILSSVNKRLREVAREDAKNQLLLHAVDEQQALRLELVDPGRRPVRVKGLAAARGVLMAFPLLLVVVALAVGAFDPRVLDDQDLRALGVPPLGHARVRRGRV